MQQENFISQLLNELSYRCNEGYPILSKSEHIQIISEILVEWGLGDIKEELIQNLTEGPNDTEGPESKFTHLGAGVYVKKGDEEKENAQKYNKDDTGTMRPISADAYEKIKAKQGEEGETAAQSKNAQTSAQSNGGEDGGAPQAPPVNIFTGADNKSTEERYKKEAEAASKSGEDKSSNSGDITPQTISDNLTDIKKFIEIGFDDSKGAPGNKGSMLNETTSILSATEYLNNGDEFDYDLALQKNVELLKESTLGSENDGDTPAGRVKIGEARIVADQYGVSIGLASKIIIATRAAQKKHNRIKKTIIEKNNITNFESIPLFGDSNGLELQRKLIESTTGEIKIGNTTITREEALRIIDESGGGDNPSDTAIFAIDKDTGNLHMSFFSDKDATNAIIAQSSLVAEGDKKKQEVDELVKNGIITEEEGVYVKTQIETALTEFQNLENQLSGVVNGPGDHLLSQNTTELIEKAKNLSGGKNPAKYWEKVVVAKFTSNRNPANKSIMGLLPENHSTPPSDDEMMTTYLKWINLEENQGNLSKPDQRVVTDLSNQTNGPKLGNKLGEIRKKSIETDLSLIRKLDERKVSINGIEVGFGTYLEAKSVFEKTHLKLLFGGKGVYSDPDGFCQENGGVTITQEVMKKCLPFEDENDFIVNFEVGEEVDQYQRGSKEIVTGGSKIVYAVTKSGQRIPVAEKKQRSKQGILGKLSTVYNFHPELQKCFDKHGK
jgi:hypothetical protein